MASKAVNAVLEAENLAKKQIESAKIEAEEIIRNAKEKSAIEYDRIVAEAKEKKHMRAVMVQTAPKITILIFHNKYSSARVL